VREITKDWERVATHSRWICQRRFSDEINKRKGLRREFWKRVQKGSKEFEMYSNDRVEKGFASPLR